MYEKTIILSYQRGGHARPCSAIVALANSFDCEILFKKNGFSANAKSIMGLMMLAMEASSKITIIANGNNEFLAVDAIANLIESEFNWRRMDQSLLQNLIGNLPTESDFIKHYNWLVKTKCDFFVIAD